MRPLTLGSISLVLVCVTACTTKTEPPTFGGILTATTDPDCLSATLSWQPATDDGPSQAHTPQNQIAYDVYLATGPDSEAFGAAPFASTSGQAAITLSGLPQESVVYFIVRARDATGNQDDNRVERSVTTATTSFFAVQTIFDNFCAVVGCHVPGDPPRGLILSDGFARGRIVGQPASTHLLDGGQIDLVMPYDADVSYLFVKIDPPLFDAGGAEFGRAEGTLMPAPQTGAMLQAQEIATIEDWIQSGALSCPADAGADQ
jgi:hypothetical protein